jgi:hypothetical protein
MTGPTRKLARNVLDDGTRPQPRTSTRAAPSNSRSCPSKKLLLAVAFSTATDGLRSARAACGKPCAGEIIVVKPSKVWTPAGNPYLSGDIESLRLDAGALELAPLKLIALGLWDPAEHDWGEEGEPLESWAEPIVARGPRDGICLSQNAT